MKIIKGEGNPLYIKIVFTKTIYYKLVEFLIKIIITYQNTKKY